MDSLSGERTCANRREEESFLELEETLIPYPDSIDIVCNNETQYLLRLERPFQFEKQILMSRLTPYDNEDYTSILSRFKDVVDWYHATVYNYENSVLNENGNLICSVETFCFGKIFSQMSSNIKAVEEILFYNDIMLVSGQKYYRYILSRNQLLFRGTLDKDKLIDTVIDHDELSGAADEMIIILTHPKRGANVWGEQSYQKALVSAGELVHLIQLLFSHEKDAGLRMHKCFYDYKLIGQFGLEDDGSIPIALFEYHRRGETA
ncbi:MAG: hypothetical protein SOS98_02225 [Varibaculum sp.]|nr:hypothetical protein [Varibaculum sp.]